MKQFESHVRSRRLTLAALVVGGGLIAPSLSNAATTKYWITRAATCSTYSSASPPGTGNLKQPKDSLRAFTDRTTYGYCDVKLPDNATIKSGRAYGSDTSIQTMSFAVRKSQYCAEAFSDIVAWSSTNNSAEPICTSAQWTSATVTEAVNNSTNSDYFYFEIPYALDPDLLRLWNVEIQYEVP